MKFSHSDILSYFFNGNKVVYEKIKECIEADKKLATTCINSYEILKGLKYRSAQTKENKFKEVLQYLDVIYLDNSSIEIASDIYSSLRKSGVTISDADILIASIVISKEGTFITNNLKHYVNIKGLTIEQWI